MGGKGWLAQGATVGDKKGDQMGFNRGGQTRVRVSFCGFPTAKKTVNPGVVVPRAKLPVSYREKCPGGLGWGIETLCNMAQLVVHLECIHR